MRALWLAPWLVAWAHASTQVPLGSPPLASSVSIVDLLSASPDHTLLLRAFQRARLIPVLNRLNGSTLFAPTDDAIRAEKNREKADGLLEDHALWTFAVGNAPPKHDNLQLELRDTLLYHVLNYTLFYNTTELLSDTLPLDIPTLQETLLHPSLSPYNKSYPVPPSLPGSPREDPDPDRPKSEEGLLRGEGQRLRVTKKAKGQQFWVGGDWQGEGGVLASTKTLRYGSTGSFIALDGVLQRPPDVANIIRSTPELSTFASLLPPAIFDYISTAAHLTLFAPTNEAWDSLSDLELRYLRSGFAESDLAVIFGDASSREGRGNGKVAYLEALLGKNDSAQVNSFLGSPLLVEAKNSREATVNGTQISRGDIFASNGVVHTLPSLLLPSGSLSLTAEKYLIALNATRFVSLLRSVNLSHYVQVPSDDPSVLDVDQPAYTILAAQDNVIDQASQALFSRRKDGNLGLPEDGSEALKELLEYHIVSGRWTTDELQDGMLLKTELRPEGLSNARQRLEVNLSPEEIQEPGGWWKLFAKSGKKKPDPKRQVVSFGGSSIVADPIKVGNSIIYLVSSMLDPPAPLITTAVSDLRLSTFVASLYAAGLDQVLQRTPAITYLVPENDAFRRLGLVMSYLLLPIASLELRSLLRYHAIDEISYLEDFPIGGSNRYRTLEGSEIFVERSSYNTTLAVHGPTVGGLPANGETRDGKVTEGNILTSTGVLHLVDQVELPPSLDISVAKLLKGAKATTMVDLIRAANMSWLLDGSPAPSPPDEPSLRIEKHRSTSAGNRTYTLLCPTDKAFSRLNLTYYLSTPEALSALVRLHVIPTDAFATPSQDGKPLLLSDERRYPSLLDRSQGGSSKYGVLAFRRWGEDNWLVGIKSARGTSGSSDSARVVAWGRATPTLVDSDGGTTKLALGGGVITIDNVLLPFEPGWFRRWGWIVAVVLLGVTVVSLGGFLLWRRWRQPKHEYVSVEGEED